MDDASAAVNEGMFVSCADEVATEFGGGDFMGFDAGPIGKDALDKIGGDDAEANVAIFSIFHLRVLNVWMNCDGEIGGKGPGCGGPDEKKRVGLIGERKFDVDAGIG